MARSAVGRVARLNVATLLPFPPILSDVSRQSNRPAPRDWQVTLPGPNVSGPAAASARPDVTMLLRAMATPILALLANRKPDRGGPAPAPGDGTS